MKRRVAFDIEKLDSSFAAFYRKLLGFASSATRTIRKAHANAFPPVAAWFLNDRLVNARAALDQSGYRVGLNVAVPAILHFCFNNLLRSRLYFPELGDSANETRYRDFSSGIPLRLPDHVPLLEALPGIVNVSRPLDDTRAAGAVALTQIAVSFCLYHELAHIELGHVVSSRELFGAHDFLEFAARREWPTNRRRLTRVWEYEADKIASMMVAADMFSADNVEVLSDAFDLPKSPEALTAVALSAIYVVFFLFGQRAGKDRRFASHPHPMVRFGSTIEALVNDVPRHARRDADRMRTVAMDTLFMTHGAWDDLGLPIATNLTNVSVWKWIFRGVDDLERDRRALHHHYSARAWSYPFEAGS